jgi:hypothetical protein
MFSRPERAPRPPLVSSREAERQRGRGRERSPRRPRACAILVVPTTDEEGETPGTRRPNNYGAVVCLALPVTMAPRGREMAVAGEGKGKARQDFFSSCFCFVSLSFPSLLPRVPNKSSTSHPVRVCNARRPNHGRAAYKMWRLYICLQPEFFLRFNKGAKTGY